MSPLKIEKTELNVIDLNVDLLARLDGLGRVDLFVVNLSPSNNS